MARPARVDAVLFDFDDTLCQTEDRNLVLVRGILHDMGVDATDEDLLSLSGGDDRVVIPPLLERYGATGDIEDYERARDGCYRTYAEADLELEPGVRELVEGLRARGVAAGIVSTTPARCILTALARLRCTSLFDVIVCGDMVAQRKPHPDPYLRALELIGVAPEHALVVEDSETGIAAGRAAGCYVMAYRGCSHDKDVSAADEAIDSFVGLEL